MAVDLDNGFTRIANELMEVVMKQRLNGTQFKIVLAVWRFTYGFQRKEHDMSLGFISKATGVHKQTVKKELETLINKNIIKVTGDPSYTKSRKLSFNKNYDEWNDLQLVNKGTVSELTDSTVSETTYTTVSELTYQERNNKESNKETIPYKKIIDYLNEKTGKSFSSKTKKTKDLISARWNEGKRLDDFISVIDYFSMKWIGVIFNNGQPAEKYLQPSTLFNGKFDERVNEAKMNQKKKEVQQDNDYTFVKDRNVVSQVDGSLF